MTTQEPESWGVYTRDLTSHSQGYCGGINGQHSQLPLCVGQARSCREITELPRSTVAAPRKADCKSKVGLRVGQSEKGRRGRVQRSSETRGEREEGPPSLAFGSKQTCGIPVNVIIIEIM